MHLLAATPGQLSDGTEPVDLAQTPADIVVLSAADTELAGLSQARSEMEAPPTLRLANLTHLAHPLSVDMHLEACATRARLVIIRLLGGAGYWRYGFEQYAARLREAGVPVAFLPGDDKPDEELRTFSTVADDDYDALWAFLVEGGPQNAVGFLTLAQAMLGEAERPAGATPLLKAGLYWPGAGQADLPRLQSAWIEGAPVVPLVFYRALVQGAGLNPINRLVKALARRGLNPMPVFVASLKDPVSAATLAQLFEAAPPAVILNCTAFATGTPDSPGANPFTVPAANDAPTFQVVLSGGSEEAWAEGLTGLSARDIAMNVALPEVDGRILSRAVSFKDEAFFDDATQCPIATYRAEGSRVDFVADLAAAWARLRATAAQDRQVALILANYPNKDGRLANGVGLDTPAATVDVLKSLAAEGYTTDAPEDADTLMQQILAGPTNWLTDRAETEGGVTLPLATYEDHYKKLPYDLRQKIEDRWGAPHEDPFHWPQKLPRTAPAAVERPREGEGGAEAGFKLSILQFGNVTVGIQPARGYNIDPEGTYHAPDLVPPHNYIAFYIWLRHVQGAHAIVHMGKHGNLEWLPGKALALSAACAPEAVLGPMPHIYPFIVNDPGEGTQAKRRAQAVILDHLTPPLTRAETYGPLRDLEALVDEYYEAAGVDPRRVTHLRKEILSLAAATGLDADVGMGADAETDLAKLDAYLCELKEAQIRDGLHVFGTSPEGDLERDLVIALARAPRGDGTGRNASLIRALAVDCGVDIDPLDCDMGAAYTGPRHALLEGAGAELGPWRSNGDTVERLEALAQRALGWTDPPEAFTATAQVLAEIHDRILPSVRSCGPAEMDAMVRALDGRAIAAGSSGAPTRGRLDVLPTGRNFFSVDTRAVPTQTAWALGWKSATLLIEKHLQDHGDWPRALLLTAWGTANMRTGGDDIAQCLALMGVKPTWDAAGRRVTGFEVLPASVLGRPRVDVTLRVSGFFRDAFPGLVDLVDAAARAVQALDEPTAQNPAKATPGHRVYGSKPGAYGAGLQAMIDERLWKTASDLGEAYLEWSSYAYGKGSEGARDRAGFAARLTGAEAIVQNQDNREHDILDSDDYYQFEGGAAAAISTLKGESVPVYHNDHSRPESPRIRTLDDEIGRVVRSRAANPKWIAGVMRHGYKGAFEMAATTDYLFAFAATTGAVKNHHFDMLHEAYLEDDETREFIATHNAPALHEMAQRFQEAIDRGLWQPRSNSARALLAELLDAPASVGGAVDPA
ncbi:MAG: cobaltochelatase subunit CobN [Pseudomonadota bacterium]